jgi:hypothetical protein
MSAAAFAKGLLDLEGELTPILVCSSSVNICQPEQGKIIIDHFLLSPGFTCQQGFIYARWTSGWYY